MTLTPVASDNPVRQFESGDLNSAIVVNVPAQGFLNQALAISVELESIVTVQTTIGTRLTQLADAISLKDGAIALRNNLQSERSQSATADTQATSVETGITLLASATTTEANRVAGIDTKLDSVNISTYQAFSSNLSAIGAAAASASNYLYSNPSAVITYATPQLSTGTRMQDVILQATLGAGAGSPTIAGDTWVNLPLLQTLNNASEVVSYNSTTREITLGVGEYSIEGYVVATNTQLVQMSLLQGATRYLGSSGKGTNEAGVIGGDRLSIYSHLMTSFRVTSTRVYNAQIFLSSGAIVSSSLSETTPWAFLRVRHYQY
jgi:hypothetical protein